MTWLRHPALSLALAALIVLTTMSMAQARIGLGAGGTLIVCIGGQAVTVPAGADGTPQLTPHACPDCIIGTLALAAEAPAPAPPLAAGTVAVPRPGTAAALSFPAAFSARAPPV